MQVSTCWTGHVSDSIHEQIRDRIAIHTAEHYRCFINGGVSLDPFGHFIRLIEAKQYEELLSTPIDYQNATVNDVWTLIGTRQVLGFYQKDCVLKLAGVDRKSVTLAKWFAAETKCRESNIRLRPLMSGAVYSKEFSPYIEWAKHWIRRSLGRAPRFSEIKLRYGPGATADIKKKDATPQVKLASGMSCSEELYHSGYLPELLREMPHLLDCHTSSWSMDDEGQVYRHVDLKTCPGKLQLVSKNYKEDRSIDGQPTLNTLLQCGIGDFMMERLKVAGLDLFDRERNRRLARAGSITGELSTIDLSSASDTISRTLVRMMLPADWYRLLSIARSGTTVVEGSEVTLEKFSAMGNGYTFPLESAIFHALNLAVYALGPIEANSEDVSTFGDDMICHTANVESLTRLLEFCGFEVNLSKSYSSGPFRESCGGDYLSGIDIRPFYLKKVICGETLFSMHNYFQRIGQLEIAAFIKTLIPSPLRLYGPDGYGDGHLVSYEWKRIVKREGKFRGWEGSYFDTYARKPIEKASLYPGDYVTPLYSIYLRDCGEPDVFSEPLEVKFSKDGRPLWVYPGDSGYSKRSIYTLG